RGLGLHLDLVLVMGDFLHLDFYVRVLLLKVFHLLQEHLILRNRLRPGVPERKFHLSVFRRAARRTSSACRSSRRQDEREQKQKSLLPGCSLHRTHPSFPSINRLEKRIC